MTFAVGWPSLISIALTALWQTTLSHVVSLSAVGIGVAVVLVIVLVPGGLGLVRTALGVIAKFLLGTGTGRAILLGLICLVVGWEARAVLDRSVALRQQLEAQMKAAEVEKATASAALAAAAREHDQAVAMRDLGAAATKRAEDAERQDQGLQDQVDDYASDLRDADAVRPPAQSACSHALTTADVAALSRIGGAPAAKTR